MKNLTNFSNYKTNVTIVCRTGCSHLTKTTNNIDDMLKMEYMYLNVLIATNTVGQTIKQLNRCHFEHLSV